MSNTKKKYRSEDRLPSKPPTIPDFPEEIICPCCGESFYDEEGQELCPDCWNEIHENDGVISYDEEE